jgi:3-isopropylmalate/(R)-2-methylmalate dehydratase large subunit
MREGILQVFIEAGANVESSNCGPCFGSPMGVISGKSRMISSSNRNYRGRMGSPDTHIFLASPATVVASAIAGRICDPRELL